MSQLLIKKVTSQEARTAFLKAAKYIRQNPHKYHFMSVHVPKRGDCGCMWGFVGRYLDLPYGTNVNDVAKTCNLDCKDLYSKFNIPELDHEYLDGRTRIAANSAAARLRAFADAKFPAIKE